ncbi:MAG TPA: bifunctional 4-hydroxy-2-oxoglutarate aldolase/2-dehydro-3-deoxy-phosphogluconate aldolase [Aestuariivirgaceae bacterium]|nr:bifunctional 4-hydroxy-2-oxoglutarate aldolase/2-dehydro-3-deoxy-phosphogluconate aldolase [Aestuariivirgaceae bacterium]
MSLLERLKDHPVVPVVTIDDPAVAPRLADALLAGGIGIIEVTLRSEAGLAAIRRLKQSHPAMVVAAGTVLSARQMADAAEAGADFAVSPGATPALFKAATSMQFPYLPGVATATEAMAAAEAGFDVLKFFPAQAAGGIALLKGLADPLPHLSFCPTGGVSAANLADWLGLANVVCAGGTWIATREALGEADWHGITTRAAAALAVGQQLHGTSGPPRPF